MKAIMAALVLTTASVLAGIGKHYELVPKDLDANLAWRREVLELAGHDRRAAMELRAMCAEDILFYVNGFCWTYDPRQPDMRKLPFITYGFQDAAIGEITEAVVKGRDVACPKSRCMGASWLCLTVFEHFWHFQPDMSFLLISRNEQYVDEKGNPKSLFWKIDFLHENQPRWLLPTGRWLGWDDANRKALHLGNADNGSVIDGESTTGDAGRGDRRSGMLIDEHAAFEMNDGFRVLRATRDTTRCRIFNSTPQGATNAFAEVCHKTAAKIVRMHWTSHPVYNLGLYTSEGASGNQRLKLLSDYRGLVTTMRKGWDAPREVMFPDDYPFILDGKQRSPWYDAESARCVSDAEVAQELDIDFIGSDYQFFDAGRINALVAEARAPFLVGDLIYERDSLEPVSLEENPRGKLRLWLNLDATGAPPPSRYVLGVDIATGTGASNSVVVVGDAATGQKVAELATPYAKPHELAGYAIALARWFRTEDGEGAFLAWEANGPGRIFGDEVMNKSTYRNIYYRKNEQRLGSPATDFPGFWSTDDSKLTLLSTYRKALNDGLFDNPSQEALQECLQYVYTKTGTVEHGQSQAATDPSGARANHGDRVIADALCYKMLSERAPEPEKAEPKVLPGSFIARRMQRDAAKREVALW